MQHLCKGIKIYSYIIDLYLQHICLFRVQNLADRKVQQNSQLLLLNVDIKNVKAEMSRLNEKYLQAKDKQVEIGKRLPSNSALSIHL